MLLSSIIISQSLHKLSSPHVWSLSPSRPVHVCRSAGAPELISFMRDLMDGLVFRALHPLFTSYEIVFYNLREWIFNKNTSFIVHYSVKRMKMCHWRGGERIPSMIIDFFFYAPVNNDDMLFILWGRYCRYELHNRYIWCWLCHWDIYICRFVSCAFHGVTESLCWRWNSCGRWTRSVLNTRYSNMLALNGCKVFLMLFFSNKMLFRPSFVDPFLCSSIIFWMNECYSLLFLFKNLIAFCMCMRQQLKVYMLKQ